MQTPGRSTSRWCRCPRRASGVRRGSRPPRTGAGVSPSLLGAVIVVLVAGQAGAALGSSPLAAPGRPPSVVRYVVRPGDSLWTVAGRVAPDEDPRPVVDALEQARHGAPLLAGETIVWQR